ncbi:hypothetical protein JBE04_06730 [Streptomyces sp. PRKS01-29]|nr:hypothetical protein [Streptomyces sabulosicollis]MBI0294183.1 hypothetical protein [Streptomyces sabulosicollis]
MTGAPGLQPEDRPDFERVLRQALNTPEIRRALRQHSSSDDAETERLRSEALAESAAITAAAAPEYDAYLRQRATTAPSVAPPDRIGPARAATGGMRGLLPAVAVLTPVLGAAATAVFLLLGYVVSVSASGRELGDQLLTAGKSAAVVTAVTTVIGVTWLLITASRHRSSSTDSTPNTSRATAAAREAWQRALLERGILPFLRDRLRQAKPIEPTDPGRRSRLGFSSPDFEGPEYAGPDFTVPRPPSED